MSDKRIYELTEASVVGADDFLALDSSEFSETKKIKMSTLTNGLVFKESLTNLIINSDTNNTGSTITKGTVFYLYGELCIALVDIASGAEFTPSTNYDNITVGGQITEIKSALTTQDIPMTAKNTFTILTDSFCKKYGNIIDLAVQLKTPTSAATRITALSIPSQYAPSKDVVIFMYDVQASKALHAYFNTSGELIVDNPSGFISGEDIQGFVTYIL